MVDLPTPLVALRSYLDVALQLKHFEKTLKNLIQASEPRYGDLIKVIAWNEFEDLSRRIDSETSKQPSRATRASGSAGTADSINPTLTTFENSIWTENAITMAIDGVDRSKDVFQNLPLRTCGLADDDPLNGQSEAIQKAFIEYLNKVNIDWTMVIVCRRCRPGIKYPKNLPRAVIQVMATPRDERWPEVKRDWRRCRRRSLGAQASRCRRIVWSNGRKQYQHGMRLCTAFYCGLVTINYVVTSHQASLDAKPIN